MPKRYPDVMHAPLQSHAEFACPDKGRTEALFRYRSLSHVLSR